MSDQLQDQMHLHGIDPLQGRKLFVRKRDGRIEEFNEARISLAIESAFKAVEGISRDARLADSLQAAVKKCADAVTERVLSRAVRGEELEVERIQDLAEEQLMLDGHLAVARRYILYRAKRSLARAEREGRITPRTITAFPLKTSLPLSLPAVPISPAKAVPDSPLLEKIYSQALPKLADGEGLEAEHRRQFVRYINEGEYLNQLAPELMGFDLEMLGEALRLERDELFPEAGLQELRRYYLLQDEGRCIETPQYFWMRLAMGLALNEGEQCNLRALEFYAALSTFRFVPSETILAHAGLVAPHLANCCSATSWSDLEHVTSQNGPQMAPRQKIGLTCSWLEPWHSGIWDFLQRPRPGVSVWNHDLNKALWIPDLFMKRVSEQGSWTLFEPSSVPDLHQQFGRAFEERYLDHEQKAQRGEIQGTRRVYAADLWGEILASLAETGQPWLGFKDAANVRSPQDHAGVVHSASLCTSILLNTSAAEASACSVGAVNLAAHLIPGASAPLDLPLLQSTVSAAIRMLDNALDLSVYPSDAAQNTGQTHRPAALGIFGFQDALNSLKIHYGSTAAVDFAGESAEVVSYCAILASSLLARERGAYPSYKGSKWGDGLLPIDTIALLAAERGTPVDVDLKASQDWDVVRQAVHDHGMRNCTTTAISSTEAASRLTGISPSIEPVPAGFGKNGAAFKIAPSWLIECAARRQKWLDMSQTLTLYAAQADAGAVGEMCRQAWEKGLKTIRQLQTPERLLGDFSDAAGEFANESENQNALPVLPIREKPEHASVK